MKFLVIWPIQAARGLVGGLLLIGAFLLRSTWNTFWLVGEVAVVAVVGALVGGIFGWAMASPPEIEATTLSHAAIGGLLAAVAGLVLTLRERQASRNSARYRFNNIASPH